MNVSIFQLSIISYHIILHSMIVKKSSYIYYYVELVDNYQLNRKTFVI